MPSVTFRTVLRAELERRRAPTPATRSDPSRAISRSITRRSRRSFAASGGLTGRKVRAFGRRLRLPAPEIAELCALENEAAVLSALDRPNFQADSRWVASMVGIPIDEVNVTLQRLLRKRIVTMTARARWERV